MLQPALRMQWAQSRRGTLHSFMRQLPSEAYLNYGSGLKMYADARAFMLIHGWTTTYTPACLAPSSRS
eukprot:COSAG03_NODE_2219_length_2992_cov_2.832700_4_plen_68_part_00